MTKLLLDESIPRRLIVSFPSTFEVTTVQAMGWAGTKNGELLALAAQCGFAALITADKNIEFQQNLSELPCAVIVMSSSFTRLQDLVPLVPEVVALLREPISGLHRVGA